jgi:glycosyltransferase involved in cell wall biosynthesis
MLVTDVGGLAEIVPNGKVGYVCKVNEEDIAKAIQSFANMDAAQREKQFRKNIQTEKQKYAWSNMTKLITEYV